MNFSERSRKLGTMKYLIESGLAVTAESLSQYLKVSTRTIYRMVEDSNEEEEKISYCYRSAKYFVKK